MKISRLKFRPQFPTKFGLEIVALKDLYNRSLNEKHDFFKPNRVEFNCLIYIEHGQGSHFIDFDRFPFDSSCFILINHGQVHAFDFTNKLEGWAIFFTQEFEEETNNKIRLPFFSAYHSTLKSPIIRVEGELKASCEIMLNEIIRELSMDDSDMLITQLTFSTLLLKITRHMSLNPIDRVSKNHSEKAIEFIALLEEHYKSERDAVTYAEKMGITYKSLNQICKSVFNNTPKHLIDSYLVLEAKRKLILELTTISDLAFELGFKETTNFTKFFKKQTGFTPLQFKKLDFGS